jgi:DNA anti-recombination protein RmuC
MDMSKVLLEEIFEEELSKAFEVRDREALRRYVKLVVESFSEKDDIRELSYEMKEGFRSIGKDMELISDKLSELKEGTEKEILEIRSDIRLMIEMMNKRFEEQREYTDKRFQEQREYTDKRFEELLHYSDKRFEDMNRRLEEIIHYSDKRFEDMNKRFDDMNKRFEDMNKKFNLLTWLIGVGFTVLTVLITIFRFVH